jgi:hypothetical protein
MGTSDKRTQLEKEVVSLLSISERGHAELMDQIPGLADVAEYDVGNFALSVNDLDDTLAKVAEFIPGRKKEQGKYKLNDQGQRFI